MGNDRGQARVVVADDHPVALLGIRWFLHGRGNLRVVGEAGGGRALLELLAGCACDLLVTDFSMPGDGRAWDGLALLRRVRRSHPSLRIVVLTMLRNPALTRGMLAEGIHGVVSKAAAAGELWRACRTAMDGQTYVEESMRPVAGKGEAPGLPGTAELSPREAAVVRMYGGGLSITEIARRLRRSVKTVSQQKIEAMHKLGLDSDGQLYEFVHHHGLDD